MAELTIHSFHAEASRTFYKKCYDENAKNKPNLMTEIKERVETY